MVRGSREPLRSTGEVPLANVVKSKGDRPIWAVFFFMFGLLMLTPVLGWAITIGAPWVSFGLALVTYALWKRSKRFRRMFSGVAVSTALSTTAIPGASENAIQRS